MSVPPPGLYVGRVTHRRTQPRRRFAYRVFWVLADVDRPGEGMTRLFGHNRFNLLSLHDRDHGLRDGSPLRPWVEDVLRQAGIGESPAAIRLLCFPRLWGFVFNPLSVFFCYAAGRPFAAVYEVHNTFGETHAYVARLDAPAGESWRHAAEKLLYVSPLIGMEGRYAFALRPPEADMSLAIGLEGPEGPILAAAQAGRYRPLTARAALKVVVAHPLMTLKILAAIHWEALGTWLRGARYVPRLLEPVTAVSIAHPIPSSPLPAATLRATASSGSAPYTLAAE